ncbi:ribosome biogenesis protein bop1-like isoform X2 [Lineus longissimus]|uniref:ribosome biogenesis protein bop1-like isoform X2 n=1 Tax=Lineus longissimus TaxID=88925 RepID=UPI00315D5A76
MTDHLFADAAIADVDSYSNSDSDSTDSEESVYSGLEEEENSEEDEEEDDSDEDLSLMSENSLDNDSAVIQPAPIIEKGKQSMGLDNQPSTSQDGNSNVVYPDEYEFDSSDEEDIRNTVGNIPMGWYREYGHIGYDWEGRKLIPPKTGDELDEFLDKMENPEYWRTVKDKSTGQNVILSKEDVETIQRIRKGKYTDTSYDPHEPWTEIFVNEPMIHPVTNRPEHKRSFIPSHNERLKVGRMVHAMKMGWMKPMRLPDEENEEEEKYYNIWGDEDQSEVNKRLRQHIPAPKLPLPGHAESYNPPPEYLMDKDEEEAWKEMDPEDRRLNFIPRKYSCLRLVPSYVRFINERFERCLDLYLCPRQRKMRMNVNAEDLIPKLPKPKDLQPFPTTQAIVYKGHKGLVRTFSVDPEGQWLASGSDDESVKFWEVSTGRCMKTMKVKGAVKSIAWNPNPALSLVAIAVNTDVLLVNPSLGDKVIITATDNMLNVFESPDDVSAKPNLVTWDDECPAAEHDEGLRLRLSHANPVSQVTWHSRGDYFATLMPEGQSMSVVIHQLSKRKSQSPFKKSKGLVQCVRFHPTRPFFFVATQRYVRVYNLVKQELTKKLMTNCKWVSSLAIHPGGDNLIIGSYDCRLSWFDLDLSTKPYQTLRHHKKALRQVAYHSRYPLFASASDDGTVIVCHGMVYNDLLQNPVIVPVKMLRGHEATKDLGVLDCMFHPTQPWLFSSGSDMTIRLFT